ncbi:MAG: nuclear transport factor 2 family protein [Actinomycetota bacterium]
MSGDTLVRQYVEAVNRKDPSRFAALFAEDAVIHDPFFPEPTKGRPAAQALLEGVLRAFPDMNWQQVGAVIEAGDRVAFVVMVEGTNDGPLAMPGGEMPATGRQMSYEAAVFWTLGSDGLITEERSYFDATGVAAQLGMTG